MFCVEIKVNELVNKILARLVVDPVCFFSAVSTEPHYSVPLLCFVSDKKENIPGQKSY